MSTIYDVARRAGASPKTVSRVLNGEATVGKSKREAVENAITELGYVPSSAARMMRSNRSGLIGLITGAISQSPDAAKPVGLPDLFILQGIQRRIGKSEKTLMIADTEGKADRIAPLVRTFLQHRVEGLIYVADYHQKVSLSDAGVTCPLVLANCYDDHGTPAVVPDDRNGQKKLVSSLILNGHRRIAYLTPPPDMVATQLRTEGYREALSDAGLPFVPSLVYPGYSGRCGQDSGQLSDAIDQLLNLPQPPSVFCCGNDEMAMRTYGILRSRGMKVPEEISVAGYDNYRTIAETLFPPLTTVELPYAAIGEKTADFLLSTIGVSKAPQIEPLRVGGTVSWRESVTTRPNF